MQGAGKTRQGGVIFLLRLLNIEILAYYGYVHTYASCTIKQDMGNGEKRDDGEKDVG